MIKSKNYAAGVLVTCIQINNENNLQNKGFVLLGREKGGWSYFQGWQDKGDFNQEFTAAREGFEESNGVVGNLEFLLEKLCDKSQNEEIFQGCFHISLGDLKKEQMDYIIQLFNENRRKFKSTCYQEHAYLKWVSILDFYNAIQHQQGLIPNIASNSGKQCFLRKFIYQCFPKRWDKNKKQLQLMKLLQGSMPFDNQDEIFQDWIQNIYTPIFYLKYFQIE